MGVLEKEIEEFEENANDLAKRRRVSSIDCEIEYLNFREFFLKGLLSDKRCKSGYDLVLIKKVLLMLRKISRIAFWTLIIIFIFSFNLPVGLFAIILGKISSVCKDKAIDYSTLISEIEVALNEYNMKECKVDLAQINKVLQDISVRISLLKEERATIKNELESQLQSESTTTTDESLLASELAVGSNEVIGKGRLLVKNIMQSS